MELNGWNGLNGWLAFAYLPCFMRFDMVGLCAEGGYVGGI